MKPVLIFIALLISGVGYSQNPASIYDFTVKDINGKDYPLSQIKGKKVMIVNTASKCGFTPQYKDLEKLYKDYQDKNFIIIGFPANNFMKQEPGSNEEIAEFCQLNYGVTFPMMSKISVKGNDIHPLYKWLTTQAGSEVTWNFQKFLIDENGKVVKYFAPNKSPLSKEIVSWIKGE
ncbi:MAG: glutathione peroxidase [Prolixibacteraceae bacterium]|nr:glutathione peroxidase [Prolixibacteraceae bacterium]